MSDQLRKRHVRVSWVYTDDPSLQDSMDDLVKAELGDPGRVWCPLISSSLHWLETFDGQKIVWLKDFRTGDMRFNQLLRMLDNYPMSLNPVFDRGETTAESVTYYPTCVVITTRKNPEELFVIRSQEQPEDIAMLKRRIENVVEYKKDMIESDLKIFL